MSAERPYSRVSYTELLAVRRTMRALGDYVELDLIQAEIELRRDARHIEKSSLTP